MADLVDARDFTYRREITFQKDASNDWVSFIGNHPDITVLFCKDIDAPIRPRNAKEVCRAWNPIPSGRNYLVASIQCWKDLAR